MFGVPACMSTDSAHRSIGVCRQRGGRQLRHPHPELVLSEKVSFRHKACKEIMRLGNKYRWREFSPRILSRKV